MSVALLCPGQGTELASVAMHWYHASSAGRRLIDGAAELLGEAPRRLLHASGIRLVSTRAYQPVQIAVSLTAVLELSSRGIVPQYVAGHSLGELTACAAAGAFADETAVEIAALRGALMARESERHPGRMLSIRASSEEADEALAIASSAGPAVVAARNSPDDYLLSGSDGAMRAVPARFSPASLHTDGAWHSPAMAGAVDEFRSALTTRCGNASHSTWLANRTGDVVSPTADVIPLLVEALTLPVRWYDVMKRLQSLGVRKFVTVGPSRALRIFARKTLGTSAVLISVETPDDLSRASDALGV